MPAEFDMMVSATFNLMLALLDKDMCYTDSGQFENPIFNENYSNFSVLMLLDSSHANIGVFIIAKLFLSNDLLVLVQIIHFQVKSRVRFF
jgi:hypothetical protein